MQTMTVNTEVLNAYLACALWSSTDEEGEPLDATYTIDDLSTTAIDRAKNDVEDFLALCERENIALFEQMDPAQIGHDFWLTRNHHGAGFWDRGLGELGEKLTTLAHPYGEAYLYPGDDGKLYLS